MLRSVRAVRGTRAGPADEPPRSRLLEAFAVVLSNLAGECPVVVLLDDLHLADPSSLEALHYLAHGCADARLLVVATARPTELAERPEVGEVLARLEQDGLARRVHLEPLDPDALRSLAEAVTGERAAPALVDWIEQRSRGNPLYAIGLLRALVEEGADLSAPALRRLPEGLAERVTSRLRTLDAAAIGTLELLAVLGRQVDSRALVGLSPLSAGDLIDTIERLVVTRGVTEEERGLELTYEIAHPLVAEAIYQGISAGRRRRLHRAVGRGLLTAGWLGEAAPHFVRSAAPGDDEAIEVLRDAVRRAEQAGSFREALTILGSLVELLPAGDRRWIDVVDALSGEAQWVVDHRADHHAVFGIPALRALDRALDGLGDPARQAPVKLRLANFMAWGAGELDEAQRICTDAQRLLDEAGEPRGALLARHERAWIDYLAGDVPALEDGARAVARGAEEAGDEAVRRRAVQTIAAASLLRCRFEECDAAVAQVIGAARAARSSTGDGYRLWHGLCYASFSQVGQGRGEEGRRTLDEAVAMRPAEAEGDPRIEFEVMIPALAGDFGRARRCATQTGLVARELSRQRGVIVAYAALAAAEMGELGEARRYVDRARSIYGDGRYGFQSEVSRYAGAALTWREGRPGEALGPLRVSTTRMLTMEAWLPALPALADLAEVAGRLGQPDPSAVDGLTRVAERTGLDCHRALVALAAAWASFGAGDRPTAEVHAGRAVAALPGASWPYYLARAQCLLGLVTEDREQAVDALRSSAGIFEACGATVRRQEAINALGRLGSAGKRAAAAAAGPGALTPRERDVVDLAAAGLSARDIGRRLFIGERTVEGHLARAYAKLGVGSKAELTRRAAELGLEPRP